MEQRQYCQGCHAGKVEEYGERKTPARKIGAAQGSRCEKRARLSEGRLGTALAKNKRNYGHRFTTDVEAADTPPIPGGKSAAATSFRQKNLKSIEFLRIEVAATDFSQTATGC